MLVNFGSLNIDYVYRMPRFPIPGETLNSASLTVTGGGKGLNQSVAAARAGAKTAHIGRVGESDGGILIQTLEEAGANTENVAKTQGASGHAIIAVNDAGENTIILHGGANRSFTEKDIDAALSEYNAGDTLMMQNETNLTGYAMLRAYELGLDICLNPSPFDGEILNLPLHLVKYFFVNEIEAANILGAEYAYEEALERMAAKFPVALICLTLGSKGAAAAYKGETFFREAQKTAPTDTTGAGDTFLGYFMASYIKSRDIQESLSIASRAASICVSRLGAAASIPWASEL